MICALCMVCEISKVTLLLYDYKTLKRFTKRPCFATKFYHIDGLYGSQATLCCGRLRNGSRTPNVPP